MRRIDSTTKKLMLRPHHSLCMQFFVGKGYSKEFTEYMYEVIKLPPETSVDITFNLDTICGHCPNHPLGKCFSHNKVLGIDKKVAEICGYSKDMTIVLTDFLKNSKEKIILTGRLNEVCGNCSFIAICGPMAEKMKNLKT